MKRLIPSNSQTAYGMAFIRILFGLLLIYHGWEIFSPETMNMYLGWEIFKGKLGVYFVYFGKCIELLTGISFVLGFYTRVSGLVIMLTFLFVTFVVGSGDFWYKDQHPFMFAMMGLVYYFYGPGKFFLNRY
jgi:putative oxidoreductase